jgi:hypothetical protein
MRWPLANSIFSYFHFSGNQHNLISLSLQTEFILNTGVSLKQVKNAVRLGKSMRMPR